MIKTLSLLIISVFLLTGSYAQGNQDNEIIKNLDSLITQRFASVAPGCVIMVMTKGGTLYKKAFGTADVVLNVPMKPGMVFRIGSITKQYTAIAILQMVEQRKISLADSIQKFIKDFPYKGHAITIENLLTHTSGIIDYQVLNFPIPNAIRIDFPPQQIIDSLEKLPLDFVPGAKFTYSNSNYFLGYYRQYLRYSMNKGYRRLIARSVKPVKHTQLNKPVLPNQLQLSDGHTRAQVETVLAGHKGKYVLLNLWASWCGPCVKKCQSCRH